MVPKTLKEVSQRLLEEDGEYHPVFLKEFLDQFLRPDLSTEERQRRIEEEPLWLERDWVNVFFAGVAEHLAWQFDLSVPKWVEHPNRFLKTPLIFGGSSSSKRMAFLLTPSAFRRRLLFCGQIEFKTHRWEKMSCSTEQK